VSRFAPPLSLRPRPDGALPGTAMVLAAGIGKRMRPLTATRPKPLVEVAGKPLLDHVFDRLRAAGIGKVVVNVHYLADALEAHVRRRASDLDIVISDERAELLETGGGLAKAAALIDEDPFFAINADNLSSNVVMLHGNGHVFGGVLVEGNGTVDVGSSGNGGGITGNLVFDDNAFKAVKSYGTAGMVQNTWREIKG